MSHVIRNQNFIVWLALIIIPTFSGADELPGTKPLTLEGPIWEHMVDGVDQFLLDQIDQSISQRSRFWKRDSTSDAKYEASIQPNRERLKKILGVVDARTKFDDLELVATVSRPARIATNGHIDVYTVRWPVFRNVYGEGLLLTPRGDWNPVANVIAIPDADQSPESFCALVKGVHP